MARVCEDWFPLGTYPRQKLPGFFMDDRLKANLDILLKNIVVDWSFIILITGSGKVRVGKSVLAMQVGCYWVYQLAKMHDIEVKWELKNNLVFHSIKLIEQGMKLQKYSPLVYDEAGESLESIKVLKKSTRMVNDFLREAGQLNLLTILILPEFFDLPKGIAVTRSHLLIDVDYEIRPDGMFQRGYFKFYSERNKKLLYLKGKKELNYKAQKQDWQHPGRFYNIYTVDEKEYKDLKQEALKSRKEDDNENKLYKRMKLFRDACWFMLNKEFKVSQDVIAGRMEQLTGYHIHRNYISEQIQPFCQEIEVSSVNSK